MTDEFMNENQIWETARGFHERMADEIPNPGDMLGVTAVILTNMLVAGVMAGLNPDIVSAMLESIQQDVNNALNTISVTEADNASVQ
jgi:hypothetical protein